MSTDFAHPPLPLDALGEARSGPALTPGRRRAILIMMALIYALNYLDRQIIVILQEPIKREFSLTDFQLGLISGGVVGLFYTLMGLPLANRVDRGINRARLIAAATAAWSVMTILCGLCRTFFQLLLARIGVGVTEAALVPSAPSMIADMYTRAERPHAMGIFSLGTSIGVMAGLAVGGVVAQATSWRIALFAAGAPGLLASALFFAIAREPRRGATDPGLEVPARRPGFFAGLNVLRRRRPLVHLVAATSACTFVQVGIMGWLPSFLIRVHGLKLAEAGIVMGLLLGAAGAAGTFFGGWQASRVARHGQHATLWLPIGGLALAMPLFAAAFIVQGIGSVLALLALPLALSALWTAPSLALTQGLAPIALRAQASALVSMTANLIGISLGPIAVGALSDIFAARHGGDIALGLRDALLCVLPLFGIGLWQWIATIRAVRDEEMAPAAA